MHGVIIKSEINLSIVVIDAQFKWLLKLKEL
jgi:hypothetical protein